MTVPSSSGLRQTRGVQVECNARLSSVPIRLERGTADAPNAAAAAAVMQAKASEKAKQEAAAKAKFRQDMLVRLRDQAQARRDAAAKDVSADAKRKAGATGAGVIQRAKSSASPAEMLSEPQPAVPMAPSQLSLMCQGLSEQAFGARDLMLARCEMPMPAAPEMPAGGASSEDVATGLAPEGGQPAAQQRVVPATASASMLRAVASTAARADRQGARESRMKKQAVAKQALQRAQLVEAVMAEREAAERATALREEVAALEVAASIKEEEAAVASAHAVEHERYTKVVESERFFEALREQLREEAARSKRPLPPLCACNLDPLENHTEQCARNCAPVCRGSNAHTRR